MRWLSARRTWLALILVTLGLSVLLIADRMSRYDPFIGDAVKTPPFTSLTYGIQAFLWWDESFASLHLDWIRLMVFSHVKQIFAWKDLESNRGEWDFSRADEIVDEVQRKGLKLVARLGDVPDWSLLSLSEHKAADYHDAPPDDLSDWAAYCSTVSSRYKGKIAAYQVWNEPNLAREWGSRTPDASAYVALLRVCSQAIRIADPRAIIISAGLAPTGTYDANAHPDDIYLQALYDAGFQQYIDVLGVHAPGFSRPELSPDDAEREGRARWATFRRVEDLRRIMIRNGDSARQMAILEMGWTTDPGIHPAYAWFAVSEAEQARNMVEAYQYASDHWRPWVGLMSAIYLPDPAWTPDREEYWWGITRGGGQMGQAFIDLANMAKFCGNRVIPARAPDSPEALGLVTVTPCD